ncbi:MAG TPA: sodium:proton exchanger [Porphyromonadaceae bacterium]|nr:calcium/sodium antiporter [Paramuribaculum sp.]HAB41967.1 sodium:proton exchanger [Porphyromonadaceae bacterium]
MVVSILCLLGGLVLILLGANYLTDGASALARKMGVSDLMVGLTVVAFGTSMPEFVISLVSAIDGSAELAIGNVVGSNIANILLIGGLTALVHPIRVEKSVMTREIPMVVVASIALTAMACAPFLDGQGLSALIDRADGIILLLFFVVFMRIMLSGAKTAVPNDPSEQQGAEKKSLKLWLAIVYIAGGLAGLIFGGQWFVDGASDIAKAMGVSEALIGLTIVSVGTSLPELATSVVAAAKGSTGMAIGNIVGSNIFNILFVLGATAVVRPLSSGGISYVDYCVMTLSAIIFWIMGWLVGKRTITRGEGALLLGLYAGYMTWIIING